MNSDIIAHPKSDQSSQLNFSQTEYTGLQRLLFMFSRYPVSEKSVLLHDHAFEQARKIEVMAKSCEQNEFNNSEFLVFVKLKNNFAGRVGEFSDLKVSLKLFNLAIESKNLFLQLEQIEKLFRTSKQQEFYHFVLDLLAESPSSKSFYQVVHQKFDEIIAQIDVEKERQALKAFVLTLDTLSSQDELGLRLVFLLKKSQLTNSSIFKTISNIVTALKEQNLQNLELIINSVKTNQEIFSKMGRIIELPHQQNHPKTYARMLQYVTLKHKYTDLYNEFRKLKKALYHWSECYQIITDIRTQHPPLEYKQPKKFKESIPGLDLYNKYKDYLLYNSKT